MTQFSVAKCAELVGVKERTIHRKIKDGKLSATKNHQGYFVVDAAELYRVYPQQSDQDKTPKTETDKPENVIIENSINDATLRSQLEVATQHIRLLEDQLVYYKTRLDKLEAREDKLLESALENQKLLTSSNKLLIGSNSKKKKRWFGR